MTLTLSDLGAQQGDLNIDFNISESGLSLLDLVKRHIEWREWLSSDAWFNVDNCYCLDIETFYSALNAYVKVITLYDVADKHVYFAVWGSIKDEVRTKTKYDLQNYDITISFHEFGNEKDMLKWFVSFIEQRPKPILGHNVAHFDLSLIVSRLRYYGIRGLKFYGYTVGSGVTQRYLYFNFEIKQDAESEELRNEDETVVEGVRYIIVDTLYLARTLQIPGSLRELSKNSPFPKKDVDYMDYEKEQLSYDAVIYAVYDVLSLPYVYRDLKARIEGVSQKLKVEKRASVQCYEHAWEKGSGTIAGAFLRNLIGRVSLDVLDFNAAYLGGLTRTWKTGKYIPRNGKQIRYFDLTSAYPFSILKQGILDIMAGNFEFYKDIKFDKDVYNDLIYSSLLFCKIKDRIDIFVEIDVEKPKPGDNWNVSNRFSIPYIRSFDKGKKVADISHSFCLIECDRGDTVILTKAEYEINILLNSKFEKIVKPVKILYGLKATSKDKSLEYIEFYKMRKELKKRGDPAQVGFKVVLNSVYGKTAQNVDEFFLKSVAAATTAFVRFQILAIVVKAIQMGMDVYYSDTDSLYVGGSEKQLRALLNFANKLNEWPKQLYGEDNLKDEGENIICFYSIKRKRYAKVIENEDNSITVVIKGGSYADITWRHLLLILVNLTNQFTIEGIQKALREKNFPVELPKFNDEFAEKFRRLANEVYLKYCGLDLKDVFPQLKKSAKITLLRNFHASKLSYGKDTFQYKVLKTWEFEAYNRFLKKSGYDMLERLKEVVWQLADLYFEKVKVEKEGSRRISKWQKFYNLVKNELYNGGYGEWFADSGESESFAYYFRKLAKYLGIREINLKDSRFFLNLFEKLKEYYDLRELISSIAPKNIEINDWDDSYIGDYISNLDDEIYSLEDELYDILRKVNELREKFPMPKAYIGAFFGVYNKGERLENGKRKAVNAVRKKMKEILEDFLGDKAEKQTTKWLEEFEGLFYTNQYLFDEPKDYDILRDDAFDLNYELYQSMPEVMPVIRAKDYMAILQMPVEIDTIEFRMKEGINLRRLPNNSDKRAVTKAAMANHCGIVGFVRGMNSKPLLFRLRVKSLNSIENIELLKDRKEYATVDLFLTKIGGLFGKFRVNKFRLIAGKPENGYRINIFDAYYAAYRIAKLIHKWLEKKFEDEGVKIELPPFLFIYQTDISQQTNMSFFYEYLAEAIRLAKELKQKGMKGSPKVVWQHTDVCDVVMCEFTNNLALKVYDKRLSAMNKIASEKMTKEERQYFEHEAKEGWRAEQSFISERSIDITISYCYVLNLVDHHSYLDLLRNWSRIVNGRLNNIYKNKSIKVGFSARVKGWFSFSKNKVQVLFEAHRVLTSYEAQVMFNKSDCFTLSLAPLEGRGFNLPASVGGQAPPLMKLCEFDHNGIVFWEFDLRDWLILQDERVNVREIEYLENVGQPLLSRF